VKALQEVNHANANLMAKANLIQLAVKDASTTTAVTKPYNDGFV
jgi:hypothetical protein